MKYMDAILLDTMDRIDPRRKQFLVKLSDFETKLLQFNNMVKYKWTRELIEELLESFSNECKFVQEVLKYSNQEFEDYYDVESHMKLDIDRWSLRLIKEGNNSKDFKIFKNHMIQMFE